jgi:putative tricarboxylic transport membrane protein
LALAFGAVFGFIFGVIPGLQTITALVVLLPFTFGLDPIVAMYLFAGIIGTGGQGGSVTAIAAGVPGDASNVATVLDGYQFTKKGQTSRALGIANGTAMLGASFGLVALLLFIPVFMPFLMLFGPAELFWIMTFGLVAMSAALPGPFLKGLTAVCLGVMMSFIGYGGPTIAVPRFTFGSVYLLDGLDLVAIIMGLLVVSEALENLLHPRRPRVVSEASGRPVHVHWKGFISGLVEPFHHFGLVMRCSTIGTLVGALPGVGGVIAQFMSYNSAYATSRHKEEFGKGSVEGLIASEAAIDAKEGSSLLPTFMFGIPGNGQMALVLAAWTIHGLQPGPFFLSEHADLAWALIIGIFFANIMATPMSLGCSYFASRVPNLRPDYLGLGIIVVSVVSVAAVRGSLWDVAVLLVTGIIGYMLRLAGISVIGVVIGFILGRLMEFNFYTAIQSSLGDLTIFVASPVSAVLAVATGGVVVLVVLRAVRRHLRTRTASASTAQGEGKLGNA